MKTQEIDTQIEDLQSQIQNLQKQISGLRADRPLEEFADYKLKDMDGKEVLFSSLFKQCDELLVIHNMGKACSYCTMWGDTLSSATNIINDRVPLVLISPNEPEVMNEFVTKRNWQFKCISAYGSSFIADCGYAHEKEGRTYFMPGVSAFVKNEGKIYRANKDTFGPGDMYCSPWHFFDLLAKKVNGWTPKFEYQ